MADIKARPRLDARTRAVIVEALDALERCGCQFNMCRGPNGRPIDMVTCIRCRSVRNLRRLLKKESAPKEGSSHV